MNVFKNVVRSAKRLMHDIRIELDAQKVARGNAVFQKRMRELDRLTPKQQTELQLDIDEILRRSGEIIRASKKTRYWRYKK